MRTRSVQRIGRVARHQLTLKPLESRRASIDSFVAKGHLAQLIAACDSSAMWCPPVVTEDSLAAAVAYADNLPSRLDDEQDGRLALAAAREWLGYHEALDVSRSLPNAEMHKAQHRAGVHLQQRLQSLYPAK